MVAFIGYLLIVLLGLGLVVIFGLFITLLIVAACEAVKNYKCQAAGRRQEADNGTTSF